MRRSTEPEARPVDPSSVSGEFTLDPGESVLWTGRPRLSAAAGSLAVGGALAAGGMAVLGGVVVPDGSLVPPLVGLALLVVGLLVAGYRVVELRRTRYALTTDALHVRSGVLGRRVHRVGLERVQNSAYRQSVTGSVFGYGTVSVEAAGGGDVAFRRIENPRAVRALVDRRVEAVTDPIPGTVEQWEAVLEEVRTIRSVLTQ